jgi:hypothetical protein
MSPLVELLTIGTCMEQFSVIYIDTMDTKKLVNPPCCLKQFMR